MREYYQAKCLQKVKTIIFKKKDLFHTTFYDIDIISSHLETTCSVSSWFSDISNIVTSVPSAANTVICWATSLSSLDNLAPFSGGSLTLQYNYLCNSRNLLLLYYHTIDYLSRLTECEYFQQTAPAFLQDRDFGVFLNSDRLQNNSNKSWFHQIRILILELFNSVRNSYPCISDPKCCAYISMIRHMSANLIHL